MSEPTPGIKSAVAEPTLSVTLSEQVRSALPGRLPQLLHLAFPLALQFAAIGWWRSAGWALAIAAFGSWGLADRWLANAAHDGSSLGGLVRLARAAAATVSSVVTVALVLEMFLHLLGAPPNH
jgi:hypothetical protein